MIHRILVPSLDEGDINPKVLQLISHEKIQVSERVLASGRIPSGSENRVCFVRAARLEALFKCRGACGRFGLSTVMLWVLSKIMGTS